MVLTHEFTDEPLLPVEVCPQLRAYLNQLVSLRLKFSNSVFCTSQSTLELVDPLRLCHKRLFQVSVIRAEIVILQLISHFVHKGFHVNSHLLNLVLEHVIFVPKGPVLFLVCFRLLILSGHLEAIRARFCSKHVFSVAHTHGVVVALQELPLQLVQGIIQRLVLKC